MPAHAISKCSVSDAECLAILRISNHEQLCYIFSGLTNWEDSCARKIEMIRLAREVKTFPKDAADYAR